MLSQRTHLIIAIFLALSVALAAPIVALAHPLGNFTINRYSRLELQRDAIRVRYVIDMAEIPTFQEQAKIDLNGDNVIDAAEHDRYLSEQIGALQNNLRLIVNGEALTLEAQDSHWEFVPGQGGLQTLRLSTWFTARLPAAGQWQLEYNDGNFAGRLGWQEVVVKADGVNLTESSVPAQDLSNELRNYPQNLLQSPPAVSNAVIKFTLIGSTSASTSFTTSALPAGSALPVRTTDRFAELITIPELGFGAILAALIGAFVWGAAHAFSPGHGKTIVAAYLVGSRATPKHALFLGLTTTITHTAGVFTLGLITLFASQYVVPEQLFPWLEAISGGLVMAIGMSLFFGRLRRLRRAGRSRDLHDHEHDHEHDHPHAHDHSHDHAHDHHAEHHGSHAHSHLPPGVNGSAVTWRSLLALGISGGLLPCPSALVVMLGAIALNRVAFGLVLIVIFSIGLASTLTAIGLVMVRAKAWIEQASANGRWLNRIPINGRLFQVLPAISALFILLAGLGITLAALAQAGVIKV